MQTKIIAVLDSVFKVSSLIQFFCNFTINPLKVNRVWKGQGRNKHQKWISRKAFPSVFLMNVSVNSNDVISTLYVNIHMCLMV